jgi:hypothetical protein
MTKFILGICGLLSFGLAQAEQSGKSSEANPIFEQQAVNGRWVEYRYRPHDVTTAMLIEGGEKLGGLCHELSVEKIVVCYYDTEKSVAAYRALGSDQTPATPSK